MNSDEFSQSLHKLGWHGHCLPFDDYKRIDSTKEFNGIENGLHDWLCPSEE
jgi:hypothetical protein